MENQFSRTEMLIGKIGLEKLQKSNVIVFGIGGVGGYVVEALTRAGIGFIDIVDNDKISITNLNRQIIATHNTIGKFKTDVAEERILSINPSAIVKKYNLFYSPDTKSEIDLNKYDYIIDAIDNVTGKLTIIEEAKKFQIPVICSMGTGNKMDPTKFQITDISKTSVCPLARAIRQELKKRKISKVKVVFSTEEPSKSKEAKIPASNSYVPAAAGIIIASEVIKDLLNT